MKELALTEMKHFVELESICVLGNKLAQCVCVCVCVWFVLLLHEIFLRCLGPDGDLEVRNFSNFCLSQNSRSHSLL